LRHDLFPTCRILLVVSREKATSPRPSPPEAEREKSRRSFVLSVAEGDARLAEVVGGHFDVDPIADADADEVFAHLAGDVSQDFVTVGEADAEHGAREHLGHDAG
jgi:hypothetical protein